MAPTLDTMNAGIDGCGGGWLAVWGDLKRCEHRVFATAEELWSGIGMCRLALIDIPIGLPTGCPRQCDLDARKLLGQPRGSSVFPTPCRTTIAARNYQEACRMNFSACGKRISQQCWGIVPKIREVDALMLSRDDARLHIRESHPEVCFWSMNGRAAMRNRKARSAGIKERLAVLEKRWPKSLQTYDAMRGAYARSDVASDDIVDAMALFVAACQSKSRLQTVSETCDTDSAELPMEMVYAEF